MLNFLTSSTGSGVKLRIKSLILLVVPILNQIGVPLVQESLEVWVDSFFIILTGIFQVYGWIRAYKAKPSK
jgi:hypothetical protein